MTGPAQENLQVTGCAYIAHKLTPTLGGCTFKCRLEATFRERQERKFSLMVLLSTGLWRGRTRSSPSTCPIQAHSNRTYSSGPKATHWKIWIYKQPTLRLLLPAKESSYRPRLDICSQTIGLLPAVVLMVRAGAEGTNS